MAKMLCGILHLEYPSQGDAERRAEKYKDCPHVLFWATEGREAYVLLAVGEEKRFWAEYIRDYPENTFGGIKAELVFADRVHHPELSMRIHDELGDVSPCDSHCDKCSSYGNPCRGCPATTHYRG